MLPAYFWSGEVLLSPKPCSARAVRVLPLLWSLLAGFAVLAAPVSGADAQPAEGGEATATAPASAEAPAAPAATPAAAPAVEPEGQVLVCEGGWRYPLTETREEIGPARFARQLDLQKDLELSSHAFGYCASAAAKRFSGDDAPAKGPCAGMMALADRVDLAASNLFRLNDKTSCECLTQAVEAEGKCEGLREQLTTLRRYGNILVQRAELVLAIQVCVSPERGSNAELRGACDALAAEIEAQAGDAGGMPGRFSLSAPLPAKVAAGVNAVAAATDGRYLSVLPENFIGVRQSLCKLPATPVKTNQCTARVLEAPEQSSGAGNEKKAPVDPFGPGAFAAKMSEVTWGMCNELALADVNAATCRDADVYIDERGQLHLNRPLTTREQRRTATLCVDISDFDESHPLMVTLGLDPTGSVPKRIWPGETMRIGEIVDEPVTPEDVLHIYVLGKARGVSLAEVLRVNGVMPNDASKRSEACRIARSWVPVVDHEVPIGTPGKQAVIPIKFDRGRDGETQKLYDGDYVVLWARDIEPSGAIFASYAAGQMVGYQPPPLLGASRSTPPDNAAALGDGVFTPNSGLRGAMAGVDQPLLPRRARYPGSRVLRLGAPAGNHSYDLRVCRSTGAAVSVAPSSCTAKSPNLLVDEKLYVHGDSYFGVKFHFGYSYFPIQQFEARRTPAAQAAGANVFEVVERSSGQASYDVAALLSVYPFGRNPREFSYNPLSKDYWKHFSLVTGFTVRRLTPWEEFYLGAAFPLANGVTFDVLTAFSQREIPADLEVGQLVSTQNLEEIATTDSALAVGVSLGLSFDLDLFERAFIATWDRLSNPKGKFFSATRDHRRGAYGGGVVTP